MSRRFRAGGAGGRSAYGSGASYGSHLTTRPSTQQGTSVTCYQNAFTTYTAVGSALPGATSDLQLIFMDGNTAGASKDTIIRVGVDLAGGTSFTAIGDFLIGPTAQFNVGGSWTTIWLPYSIPAGATIGMVGSVNNATPGTVHASWLASPLGGGTAFAGTAIESVGLTPASSSGTAVTAGQAAEGSWTSLGTLTNAAKFMGVGASIGNTTINALAYGLDLSYSTDGGATKILLVEDQRMLTSSNESVAWHSAYRLLAFADIPAAATIYARAQCSGAPDAGFSMAAWAVR